MCAFLRTGHQKKMKTLYKNMASIGMLQIANYLIPFLVLPIVSRVLGASLFGSVSYAQNIVIYLTLLVNFGFEYSATRQIAIAGEDKERKRRVFWSVLTVKSILLLLSFAILGVLALCMDRVAADPRLYVYAALTNIGLVLFPTWYLQGEQQMDKMALMNFFVKLLGAALVLALVREASAYRLYPLLLSLSSIIVGIAALIYVLRRFKIGGYICSLQSLRDVVKSSWPIFLNNVFVSLYTTANMTILGVFADDEVVGYFSASHKLIIALIMIVVLPVSTTVYPEISRRFEQSKAEGIRFLKRVMLYAGMASAAVSIATYCIAPLAIRIVYGAGFMPAVEVLRWLSPIPFLVMMATLLTVQGMYGMGLQKWAPWVGMTLAVVCVTMNILLIPRLGVRGVCISWIVAEMLECVLSYLVITVKGRKQIS